MNHPTSRFRFLRAYGVTIKTLLRYFALLIVKIFVSNKTYLELLERAHVKTARHIVTNILKLKGLYVKIGQTLSMMTNFLPSAITEGLEELQDAVPPHSYDEVVLRIQSEFTKNPEEIFARFEKAPLASASLGQVHVAHLPLGAKVAVKLQYPHIDTLVRSDLKTISRIFGLLNIFFPHYGLKDVYRECAGMILKELDYLEEGKNIETIARNFPDQTKYIFPKVHWDLTTQKILTLEFMEGFKVTHADKLKEHGIDPRGLATDLIHFYCKQIFIDGVYHADPHPGNIIIWPQGASNYKIAMVDYGATARISPRMREGMTLFVDGIIKKDTRVLSLAMRQMGFVAKEDNEEVIDKIVDYFYSKIKGIKIDNFRELNIGQFQHLNDILELKKMDISLKELSQSFHIPQEWILLERTLLLMMGLVAQLDPHLNPMDIVVPYVEEFVLGKDKKVADLILQSSKELLLSYINLPNQIYKTLKKLDEGKLSFQVKESRANTERIYAAMHQLIYTILLSLCVGMGLWFKKNGDIGWSENVKWLSWFFGGLLAISFVKNRK